MIRDVRLISRPRVFSGLPSAGARAMDHIFFHSRRLASMMNRSININNTQKKNTRLYPRIFFLYSEKKISFLSQGGGGKRPGDTTGKREEMKNKDDEGYRSETIPDDEKDNK